MNRHANRSRSRGSDVSYDDKDFRSSNRSLNMNENNNNNNSGDGRSYSNRRGGGFQRKRNDSEYSNDFYPARSSKSSNFAGKEHYSSQEHMDRLATGDNGRGGGGNGLKVVEDWANNDSSDRFKQKSNKR